VASDQRAGPVAAVVARPSFEECIDDGDMFEVQYATDGHWTGTPEVRKALMRAIRCYAASPGEAIASLARGATFHQGYTGTAAGVTDYFATDENGQAERLWDDEMDARRQADKWWSCTWATTYSDKTCPSEMRAAKERQSVPHGPDSDVRGDSSNSLSD
jgi:hypothetical protein